MNIRKALALTSFLAIAGALWAGCGGPDNAGACKDYSDHVSGLKCLSGAQGAALKLPDNYCDQYNNVSCDETPYFDCLSAAAKCNGDTPDFSGQTACASKACGG